MLANLFRRKSSSSSSPSTDLDIETESFSSLHDYLSAKHSRAEENESRAAVEHSITRLARSAPFPFVCSAHGGIAAFRIEQNATGPVNWRESVVCPTCRLNARMRFCVSVLSKWMKQRVNGSLYLTEQATFGYALLKKRFQNVAGSEYIQDKARKAAVQKYIRQITGDRSENIRIEDVTRLSFANASFDVVGSFEVLEHVPDYQAALAEIARVLKPNGRLLLTAPFLESSHGTVTRAQVSSDGSITHILPPEFHGDPVSDGVLCFYHFGWDLLDALRESGFQNVEVISAWSPSLGLMGNLLAISAERD